MADETEETEEFVLSYRDMYGIEELIWTTQAGFGDNYVCSSKGDINERNRLESLSIDAIEREAIRLGSQKLMWQMRNKTFPAINMG